MIYSLSLRSRALAELAAARDRYALVGHGEAFLDELEAVFDAMQAMPLRFPIAYGTVHRALLRRYRSPCSSAFDRRASTSSCSRSFHNAAIQHAGQSAEHRPRLQDTSG